MTMSLRDFGNGGRASGGLAVQRNAGLRRPVRNAAARARRYWLCLALLFLVAIPLTAAAQQPPAIPGPLRPGDILAIRVIDERGLNIQGRLEKVDPSNNVVTTISDFGDPSQGPINPVVAMGALNWFPSHLALEDAPAIFVAHPFFGTDRRGALIRVEPSAGARTIISDFGDASQGPLLGRAGTQGGADLGGLAIEPSGDFLVFDRNGAALVRVNRSTGTRTIVSDYADPAQGPRPGLTLAVAVEESGQVVVSGEASNGQSAIFRVDPSTGVRTLLSDFGNPTQDLFRHASDLTVDPSGNILVVGWNTDLPAFSPVVRVDPVTGTRTLVIEVNQACNGGRAPFQYPSSLAVEETGTVIVASGDDSARSLLRLDPVTGACAFIPGGWVSDVAVVPTPRVNERVSLSVATTVLEPPVGGSRAPAGVFRITATFTNVTSIPIRNPFFRVAELSGGNVLVSEDRPGEVIALGGKGARQTPDVGSDGVLSPGESVMVEFAVGLQTRQPFTLFVDVFGEPDALESSQ